MAHSWNPLARSPRLSSICFFILAYRSSSTIASVQTLAEATSKDNSKGCQCYMVDGQDPGYFQYYRFWDFRNISPDGSNDYTSAPAVVQANQNKGGQPATSSFLTTDNWNRDWSNLDGVASSTNPIMNVYSAQNIFVARNSSNGVDGSTYLNLRSTRLPSFMSSAQLNSNQANMLYASVRARMRIIPNGMHNDTAPSAGGHGFTNNMVTDLNNSTTGSNKSHPLDGGAVVSMFIYESDTQESDIEILTHDTTNLVHYSNQPDYDDHADEDVPGATTAIALPDGVKSTDWINWRLDWFPDAVYWYANDHLVLKKSKNNPTRPCALIFNNWGDGGYWSGNMTVGGQVNMAIEWIQMSFNVSGPLAGPSRKTKRDDKMCQVGCRVDGVKAVGTPEQAFGDKSGIGANLDVSMYLATCFAVVAGLVLGM